MSSTKKEKAINELFNEKERNSWDTHKKRKGKKWLLIGLLVASALTFPVLLFKDEICRFMVEMDIPIVREYLKTNEVIEEMTIEELKVKSDELQKENTNLKKQIVALTEEIQTLNSTIDRLKPYEEESNSFKKQKEAWDISIAYEMPEMFIEQFKTFYPEMATQVYKELIVQQAITEKEEEYLKIIKSVETKKAAQLVQSLLTEDQTLLLNILNRVGPSKLTEIVNNVDVNIASTLLKLLNPFSEEQNNIN